MAVDQALAVELHLDGPHAARVRDWVESVLGWQPVEGVDGGLVPSLALTDAASTAVTPLPTIVLVDPDDDPVLVAGRVVLADAIAVVVWPAERDDLPRVAAKVADEQRPAAASPVLRIGGACGGVGATTVALALGGLVAWSGTRTLVLGRGHVPVRNVVTVAGEATGAHGIWAHATPVPGVPNLRALAVDGPAADQPPGHEAGLVVIDAGVDSDVDVLVGRRDAATLAALERTCASVLVLAEDGPAQAGTLRDALGRRRLVPMPMSARVAAANLGGRVPSALPGRWLAQLRPVVAGLAAGRN